MAYVNVQGNVDLGEFDTDYLIYELNRRGYSCVKDWEASDRVDLNRIEHLALCGQKTTARLELFQMVNAAIGCDLTH